MVALCEAKSSRRTLRRLAKAMWTAAIVGAEEVAIAAEVGAPTIVKVAITEAITEAAIEDVEEDQAMLRSHRTSLLTRPKMPISRPGILGTSSLLANPSAAITGKAPRRLQKPMAHNI